MKNNIGLFLAVILAASFLSACGTDVVNASNAEDKISIVTTIFPEYDWVKNVLGDNPADAELCFLLDSGVDLHSYQPTAEDILKISQCDLFIYVGGESDGWVEDALAEATNKDMIVINLLDTLGSSVKEEELVEGMQEDEHEHGHDHDEDADEDHEHDHDEDADEGHEHDHDEDADDEHDHEHDHNEEGPEYDEHVWLSLRNASVLCEAIEEALVQIDADNAAVYQANCDAYCEQLSALDQAYADAVAAGNKDTVLFGDRFPFRYLTDDYDLNYYAAFVGCSAESEASFETITFLAEKMDELSLNSVLTIETSDGRIAQTVIDNTSLQNAHILTMDSLQSTTAQDAENGKTYLGVMERNLDVLKEALQ